MDTPLDKKEEGKQHNKKKEGDKLPKKKTLIHLLSRERSVSANRGMASLEGREAEKGQRA